MKKTLIAALLATTCLSYPVYAVDINPPISTFTINGHTYTNEMWEANFQGTLSAVAADIAAVTATAGSGTVPTNAALKALTPGSSPYITRQGFYAVGDGGYARYIWSGTPCSLNGGLGDNGSQVDPDTGTGCWLADFSNLTPTPVVWGAVGNGTTNDNVAMQAAITAMGLLGRGAVLNLGNRKYCITGVTIDSPIQLIGTGTLNSGEPAAGIVACTANTNLITINASGAELNGFGIKASYVGVASATSIIINGNHNKVSFLQVHQPCKGILDLGNNNSLSFNVFTGNEARAGSIGCVGILVGNSTTRAADTQIIGNRMVLSGTNTEGPGPGWSAGIRLRNSSGAYLSGNTIFYSYTGTIIDPQNGEIVSGTKIIGSGLGDSTYAHSFMIYPGDGGIARGIIVESSWTSNSGNWNTSGVWTPSSGYYLGIDGTTGVVAGVTISDSWQFWSTHNNVYIGNNVSQVSLTNNWLCGAGLGANATYVGVRTAGDYTKIVGNTISKLCLGVASPNDLVAGVAVETNNITGSLTVTDNHIGGFVGNNGIVVEGSGFISNSVSAIIGDNIGVDNVIIPITLAGGDLTPPPNPSFFVLGSGTLGNMYGAWENRTVTMIPVNGGVNVVTGGGVGSKFCNTITLNSNVPYTAHYADGCWRIGN